MLQRRESKLDLKDLIRCCCEENCDLNFSRFRLAWHDNLVAALTRFSNDWLLMERVCDAAYQDYRQVFQTPFDAGFDYRHCLYAIGYAHLLHSLGSQPLQMLVGRLLERGMLPSLEWEEIVAVFFAILRLPGRCRFYFFEACFLVLMSLRT